MWVLVSFPRVDLRFLASLLFSALPVEARHLVWLKSADLALAVPDLPRVERISESVVSSAFVAPLADLWRVFSAYRVLIRAGGIVLYLAAMLTAQVELTIEVLELVSKLLFLVLLLRM